MTDNKSQVEESFHSDLQSVLVVLEKLKLLCETIGDAVDIVELALVNRGQLRLLMAEVSKKK